MTNLKKYTIFLFLLILVISCTHDKNYYKKRPESAKKQLEKCLKSLDENNQKECMSAYEGLYEYTYEKYQNSSYDVVKSEAEKNQFSLFNPEIEALENLKVIKLEEKKLEIDERALKYFNENIKGKSLSNLENDIKRNKYEKCFNISFDEQCHYNNKMAELIEDNLQEIFIKEFDNKSYEFLSDYIVDKSNTFNFWNKTDGNGNKLLDLEITVLLSKKQYIENILDRKFEDAKKEAQNKAFQELKDKSIEEIENLLKLKENTYESSLFGGSVCYRNEGSKYYGNICSIKIEYINTMKNILKNKKKEVFNKKYENYSIEELKERYKPLVNKFYLNRNSEVENENYLSCSLGNEECLKNIDEINVLYSKLKNKIAYEREKYYNELNETYKNEDWQTYLYHFPGLIKYKTFISFNSMKVGNPYYNSDIYNYDPKAQAVVKLYIEKREIGEKELKKISANELYNMYVKISGDKRTFTPYDVFLEEFESRKSDNKRNKAELKNTSLAKIYEMAQNLDDNRWLMPVISERLLANAKDYSAEKAYNYYREMCVLIKNPESVEYACRELNYLVEEKIDNEVNQYIYNYEALKNQANKCIYNAKQGYSCNINKFPYNLISKALRKLGSFSYDQIELNKYAEYIK